MGKPCKSVKIEEENSKEIPQTLKEAGLEDALKLPEEEQKELVAFLTSGHNAELKEKEENSKEIPQTLKEAGLEEVLKLPEEEQKELVAFLTSGHNAELKEKEEKLSEISIRVSDARISFLEESQKVAEVIKRAGLKADAPDFSELEQKAQAILHLLEDKTLDWEAFAKVLFPEKAPLFLGGMFIGKIFQNLNKLRDGAQRYFFYLPEVVVEECLGVFGFENPSAELIKKYSDLLIDPAKTRVQFAQSLVNLLMDPSVDRTKKPSKKDYPSECFDAIFESLKESYKTNSQLRSSILEIGKEIAREGGLKERNEKVAGKRNWNIIKDY